ncbi:MAG: hypothetical protein J6S14_14155 [Clostridia bacterium]|nr:hypothetical protein [Clostridia bacterium]
MAAKTVKPIPCACGNAPVKVRTKSGVKILCRRCYMQTLTRECAVDAVADWNKGRVYWSEAEFWKESKKRIVKA